MTLSDIIRQHCKREGISFRKFAEKSGLTSGYITMLLNGENPKTHRPIKPTIDTYIKIADAMGITVNELFKRMDDAPIEVNAPSASKPIMIPRRIPILGDTAAGAPIYADEQYDDFIEIPTDGREYDAAVRVQGDSMEPQFSIGDLALIRYQDDVEDGQIAVVGLDDEVTLKRVFHIKGALQLQSDNPRYPAIIAKYGDYYSVRIIGRVISAIRFGIH